MKKERKIKIIAWIGLLCFFSFIVTPFCQFAFCAKTNNISAIITDLANSAERDIEKQFSECPSSTIKNAIEQFKRDLRSELKGEISERRVQGLKKSFPERLKEWNETIDKIRIDFGGTLPANLPWQDFLNNFLGEYKKAILSPIPSEATDTSWIIEAVVEDTGMLMELEKAEPEASESLDDLLEFILK